MRPIWRGAISFGLANIPIGLYPATRREELKFRFLRASDLSPVNYKRVAEADGKEVPWDQIVKRYEHEKGKFVALKEEDPCKTEEATTSNIIDLVSVLEKSIQETASKAKTRATSKSRGRTKTTRRSRKKAA